MKMCALNVKKEIFEDVLRYLMPYYKQAVSQIVKGKKIDIQKIIEGIDLKKLEKEKSEEWIIALKEQLSVMEETLKKL